MFMIGLASMMYNVFHKKTGTGATRRSNLNEKLAQ